MDLGRGSEEAMLFSLPSSESNILIDFWKLILFEMRRQQALPPMALQVQRRTLVRAGPPSKLAPLFQVELEIEIPNPLDISVQTLFCISYSTSTARNKV